MLLRARKNARHAKPSKAAPTMVAAGMTASFVAMDVAAMATSASASGVSESDLLKLRICESGNRYGLNTGNGYYGAYQFALPTWHSLGYSGRPDQAAPATQDAAVRKLQARSGWGQWPACSRRYDLGSSSSDDSTVVPVARDTVRADRSRRVAAPKKTGPVARKVHVAVAPEVPPPFVGKPLTVADRDTFRIGVHDWQARMQARGWDITVDGYFGPQSAAIARRFASEKQLQHGGLSGEVDKVLWDAAWRLPVS